MCNRDGGESISRPSSRTGVHLRPFDSAPVRCTWIRRAPRLSFRRPFAGTAGAELARSEVVHSGSVAFDPQQVAGRHDDRGRPLHPDCSELEALGVRLVGPVADLHPLYDAARVFVAPAHVAAGVPIKILEATAAGL